MRTLPVAVALLLAACTDHGKASEGHATHWVVELATRATGDVKDLEDGLPKGATVLAPQFASGTENIDLGAVRHGLRKIRAEIPELTRSPSTFFAVSDANGVALRNDLEQDVMAGQDLWKEFPDLRKTSGSPFVVATGVFSGSPRPKEPDRDWIAAVPLKDAKGAFAGMLLGGWRMQRYAFRLQESLRHDLEVEQAKTDEHGKLPIVYAAVFDKDTVYCAPLTPDVNDKALVDLGLPAKTASGVAHGVVDITDRDFGWAATRVPPLGPDSGVVVLWSKV